MNFISKVIRFITKDLWRIRPGDVPPRRFFWLRQLQIIILSIRDFQKDKCILRASALTYYTLLSIVPILALAFGASRGFGLEKMLESNLRERFAEQKDVVDRVIQFANNLLAEANTGLVAGIGVVLLIWSIIKVLGYIEESFNEIWGIQTPRTFFRKITDYVSFVMISPFLFIISGSMMVLVNTHLTGIVERLQLWGWLGGLVFFLLKIIPLTLIWGLFAFTYIYMPNTKVRFSSALMGGILAGTAFQVVQWLYIHYQVVISKQSAIYGSFAALPMFLAWLQVSWLITLYGAEIAFAHQNIETYEYEPDCLNVSPAIKRLLTLSIVQYCARLFETGSPPQTAREIARYFETPIRLVNQIIFELTETRILSEVRRVGDNVPAFQPALAAEHRSVAEVLERLRAHGSGEIPIARVEEIEALERALKEMDACQSASPANIHLGAAPSKMPLK
ncbi:MAG TPA: YihY/virulence factor BrkB family protein [Candidatus Sumerlaeota bacterium]|nr:YihY/virulence factor BrkB family protein [Candidatus Sumerlaeota bacterium]